MNTIRVFLLFFVLALLIVLTTTNKQYREFHESQVLGDTEQSVTKLSPTYSSEINSDPYSILPMFAYPDGEVVNRNKNSVKMQTDDLPDGVTAWYIEKIKKTGMRTNSFIETNTNGYIKNVLIGSRKEGSVEILIEREPGDSFTKIEISIPSS